LSIIGTLAILALSVRLDVNLLLTEEDYEINEGTVVLQTETFTVLRMRTLFDYLIEKYPDL
jgi:hypothetical protein